MVSSIDHRAYNKGNKLKVTSVTLIIYFTDALGRLRRSDADVLLDEPGDLSQDFTMSCC